MDICSPYFSDFNGMLTIVCTGTRGDQSSSMVLVVIKHNLHLLARFGGKLSPSQLANTIINLLGGQGVGIIKNGETFDATSDAMKQKILRMITSLKTTTQCLCNQCYQEYQKQKQQEEQLHLQLMILSQQQQQQQQQPQQLYHLPMITLGNHGRSPTPPTLSLNQYYYYSGYGASIGHNENHGDRRLSNRNCVTPDDGKGVTPFPSNIASTSTSSFAMQQQQRIEDLHRIEDLELQVHSLMQQQTRGGRDDTHNAGSWIGFGYP